MAGKSKQDKSEGFASARLIFATRLLLLGAIGVGCYLAWISLTGMSAVGCGPSSGCQEVLHGRWAYWFGVPVSLFALAVYATMLAATARLGRKQPPRVQRQAWCVLIPGAVAVLGAAA
jgi:uncharacterized membrane protein